MDKKNYDDLLSEVRRRFDLCVEAEREIRAEAIKDQEFLNGEQWNADARRERESAGRPVLISNKLPVFVAQVVNEARKNKPSITIAPMDSGIDKETAAVQQGLMRHIEARSDAVVAVETAFQAAVEHGFGSWRVTTEYVNKSKGFDQEIVIKRIADSFSVYWDPHSTEIDRSDAEFCFVTESISRDEYKRRFPKSYTTRSNFSGWDDTALNNWQNNDSVRIAEYWTIKRSEREWVLLDTGEEGYREEVGKGKILRSRPIENRSLCCYIVNGAEVLEENEAVPGECIPIVTVYGAERITNGKRKLFSLIRFARDPQQLYNYHISQQAESVGLAPRAPWIIAHEQVQGFEEIWRTANSKPHAYLPYHAVTQDGRPLPGPIRNQFEPPIQALNIGALHANDDIKATMGIFDASLGAKSNETSGVAIARRQQEGDTATYHFLDNLARAVRHTGRIILGMIPVIYDTAREIRILGEDRKEKIVKVNQEFEEDRELKMHDITLADYDVAVTSGPSYTTQRQEGFQLLMELARSSPQIMQIAGDIIVRQSDIPGSDQIADRLKKALPPQLQEEEKGTPQLPPQVQAQMQQMATMVEQLTAALNEATQLIETKKQDNDSRERIAAMSAFTRLTETDAKLGSAEAIVQLREELAFMKAEMARLAAERQREEAITQQPVQPAQPQPA